MLRTRNRGRLHVTTTPTTEVGMKTTLWPPYAGAHLLEPIIDRARDEPER